MEVQKKGYHGILLIAVTNTVRRKGDYYATARREHLQAEGWSVGGPLYSRPDTCRQGRVVRLFTTAYL